MRALDVVKVEQVKTIFGVFVAALKFMLKICLEKFEHFVLHYISHAVLKANPYIRRFNAECLAFLIRKMRNEQLLRKRVGYLFSLSTEDLSESLRSSENQDLADLAQANHDFAVLKSDFMACLLFEILKGTNGYLNDQAR